MSFSKIAEVRRGRLVLKALRNMDTATILLTLDKILPDGVVRGPVLTPSEVESVLRFVVSEGHWRIPEGQKSSVSMSIPSSCRNESGNEEISIAIRAAKKTIGNRGAITVMPSMPDWRYRDSCPECGCHVASCLGLGPGTRLKVCSNCGVAYDGPR